ncbi:Hypothetical protein FKW44_006525, partial [Caligus rogercresseyi]
MLGPEVRFNTGMTLLIRLDLYPGPSKNPFHHSLQTQTTGTLAALGSVGQVHGYSEVGNDRIIPPVQILVQMKVLLVRKHKHFPLGLFLQLVQHDLAHVQPL